MERKLVRFALCLVAVASAVLYLGHSAGATPASGFSSTPLITAFTPTFPEFQVFNRLRHKELEQIAPGYPDRTWAAFEKTEGPSDLYIQSNTWKPGGSSGWHRHPGYSLIVITSGTVVQYHEDCVPQVYGPNTPNGATLVDGGEDEHLIRNEDGNGATGYTVQIVAHTAPRRIDEPTAPETCQIF